MPTTIIAPGPGTFPLIACAAVLEVRQNWTDEWKFAPGLELVRASTDACGHKAGQLQVRLRYGYLKQPFQGDLSEQPATDLGGWWIRLRLASDAGLVTSWVGRISSQSRDIFGTSPSPAGAQTWVAYEALYLLDRISISTSWWLKGEDEIELAWSPDFNARDARGVSIGNRTADKSDTSYLFGGTSTWTRRDILEYLLERFVDESDAGGPSWTIGGQTELLEDVCHVVQFGDAATAAELLKRVMPRSMGADFAIVPNEDGFEISVFALSGLEASFAGVSMPLNPRRIEFQPGNAIDLVKTSLSIAEEEKYSRIRVLGARAVVCCSLSYAQGSLDAKWSSGLEALYAAAEDDTAAREADKFRAVYQHFGAPADWDLNAGAAAPVIGADGQVQAGEVAPFQRTIRETLHYLPLKEGVEYSTDPAIDLNIAGVEPELRTPSVWVLQDGEEEADPRKYIPAESVGMSISIARSDWGVAVQARPNHVLGRNHFEGDSEQDPVFDWQELVATIAFRADQRLRLQYDIAGEHAPSDGTIDIVDETAELWFLTPGTVVGVDGAGELETSGAAGRVLRNDVGLLALTMAGAIARYAQNRVRAELTIKGLVAWSGLLGSMLACIQEGGDLHEVNGVITSVEWVAGASGNDGGRTVIKAGFSV